jgi:hypothetical protein
MRASFVLYIGIQICPDAGHRLVADFNLTPFCTCTIFSFTFIELLL